MMQPDSARPNPSITTTGGSAGPALRPCGSCRATHWVKGRRAEERAVRYPFREHTLTIDGLGGGRSGGSTPPLDGAGVSPLGGEGGEERHMPPEAEKSRREFLEEALRDNPENTFARYGLALELANKEPKAAWTHFEYLLLHHPDYSATYYQAGMFLISQDRPDDARKVLAAGIEITGHQGKLHAQQELQAALQELDRRL